MDRVFLVGGDMIWTIHLVPTAMAWLAWWLIGHWHWSLGYGLFAAAVLLSVYTLFVKGLEDETRS
jgi:hypothetical protein